eukprot:228143-Chlamydomonas_euryale.AAC.2
MHLGDAACLRAIRAITCGPLVWARRFESGPHVPSLRVLTSRAASACGVWYPELRQFAPEHAPVHSVHAHAHAAGDVHSVMHMRVRMHRI